MGSSIYCQQIHLAVRGNINYDVPEDTKIGDPPETPSWYTRDDPPVVPIFYEHSEIINTALDAIRGEKGLPAESMNDPATILVALSDKIDELFDLASITNSAYKNDEEIAYYLLSAIYQSFQINYGLYYIAKGTKPNPLPYAFNFDYVAFATASITAGIASGKLNIPSLGELASLVSVITGISNFFIPFWVYPVP